VFGANELARGVSVGLDSEKNFLGRSGEQIKKRRGLNQGGTREGKKEGRKEGRKEGATSIFLLACS
jgi:hypothetical protein